MTAFVEFDRIRKNYGDVVAVQEFNLEVEQGQLVAFVGPSGCGKSTVLRMTAGLEAITAGQIRIDGKVVNDVEPKDRDIAMVFQNYALYPDKTVFENMGFGLKMRNTDRAEIEERVRRAAGILKIEQLLERRPAQLSGGQRQRVAVGRVIVRDPKVFLFDEPLSNLDAHLRGEMRKELIKLHRRLEATMIYVTHDQVEAMTMGDVIVVMRDGEIQQHGAPLDVFNRPDNMFVASFIGAPPMNMIRGTVERAGNKISVNTADGRIALPAKLGKAVEDRSGTEIILGVRPHNMAIVAPGAKTKSLRGGISLIEQLGTETLVDIDMDGFAVQACLPPTTDLNDGEAVGLTIDFSKVHIFDAATEDAICHGMNHIGPR
jgi:multiple sugar transport system ATP-binding protein